MPTGPDRNEGQQPPPMSTSARVLAAFLSGRTLATQSVYRKDLRNFAAFCSMNNLPSLLEILLSPKTGRDRALTLVQAYRDDMRGRGLKRGTIGRRLAAIRGLFRTAYVLELIQWSIPADLDEPDQPDRPDQEA